MMVIFRNFFFVFVMLSVSGAWCQPSTEADVLRSLERRKQLAETSLVARYPVRNVGPTVQGGRVVDIDVNINKPTEFYVAFASGGVFRTQNNGITFQSFFSDDHFLGIGDIALSQTDPRIMYVGTGEKNSSRSSYAGSGIYKTTDQGKTWSHCNLVHTQHIGRIVIHPEDNNTVWVAAMGSLYSNNAYRGVFKTTDGGKTWKKTLFINDSTGVIDIAINPKNPKQLLAASWERTRKAWHFKGKGAHSTIYRSEDGGETWQRSSVGFLENADVGRIGIRFSLSNPDVVYAIVDDQTEVRDKKEKLPEGNDDKLKQAELRTLSKTDFAKLSDEKLEQYLRDNNYPKRYTAIAVKNEIAEEKYTVEQLADYIGNDANTALVKTRMKGAQLFRSDDAGKNWKLVNGYDLDGIYFTYGYYFGELEISPADDKKLFIYGVPLLKSSDGGLSWHRIDTLKGVKYVHIDHHALWINPKDASHMLLGNDGGLYQSYDEGATWHHINNMPVGQFYTVNVDMESPYNVYGGLQDNGVLKGSSKAIPNESKHWEWIFWGDGMHVAPDPRNPKTVYAGYQFGNYFRIDLEKNKSVKVSPQHEVGEIPYRWNWRSPFFISKHNNDILYTAANKVFRSFNKGETWEVISHDLTKNVKQGNVPFSSISSLAESPVKFGVVYAGTDDGNVWVTRNSGTEWVAINKGLPKNKWISSIYPSSHDEGTVFVSMNGYRDDDFRTYLFMSNDFGQSWKSIKGDLPESVANVIVQDPVNPDLLFCGLDNGAYMSLDQGNSWHLFTAMLNVPAYDMVIHPRDFELVVATHGRSVFIADIKPLQSLTKTKIQQNIIAFSPEEIKYDSKWGIKEYAWSKPIQPTASVLFFLKRSSTSVAVEILDDKNNLISKKSLTGREGFNQFNWDLKQSKSGEDNETPNATYVKKGKYKLRFVDRGDASEVFLEVK